MTLVQVSTDADLKTLQPKFMRELYGSEVVSLCGPRDHGQPGDIYHLIWGASDWSEMEARFGHVIAEWQPAKGAWFALHDICASERLSVKFVISLIGRGSVCALGKNCPKHKAK